MRLKSFRTGTLLTIFGLLVSFGNFSNAYGGSEVKHITTIKYVYSGAYHQHGYGAPHHTHPNSHLRHTHAPLMHYHPANAYAAAEYHAHPDAYAPHRHPAKKAPVHYKKYHYPKKRHHPVYVYNPNHHQGDGSGSNHETVKHHNRHAKPRHAHKKPHHGKRRGRHSKKHSHVVRHSPKRGKHKKHRSGRNRGGKRGRK